MWPAQILWPRKGSWCGTMSCCPIVWCCGSLYVFMIYIYISVIFKLITGFSRIKLQFLLFHQALIQLPLRSQWPTSFRSPDANATSLTMRVLMFHTVSELWPLYGSWMKALTLDKGCRNLPTSWMLFWANLGVTRLERLYAANTWNVMWSLSKRTGKNPWRVVFLLHWSFLKPDLSGNVSGLAVSDWT